MSYESLKSYVSEHRQSFIIAGLFVVIFGVGYGTGTSWRVANDKGSAPPSVKQNNYTTKPAPAPPANTEVEGETSRDTTATKAQVQGVQTTTLNVAQTTAPETCTVKGNISKDSKIYHVLGGSFYNRVKPELCFKTEAEAQAAGFRKSTR